MAGGKFAKASGAHRTVACPSWCRVNHSAGTPYHARLVGQVLWPQSSVVVVVRYDEVDDADCVEMTYHVTDGKPASVFLDAYEAQQLRDHLNDAVNLLINA
jgi:hypothetical protein